MICPSNCPSWSNRLYTILPCLSGCPSLSDHSSTIYTSLSDYPSLPDCLYDKPLSQSDCQSLHDHLYDQLLSPSDLPSLHDHLYDDPTSPSTCPSPSDCLTTTTTRLTVRLSSTMIQCTQDSSQSLAVINGEKSRKSKQLCRAFTNYNLLLRALDASSIYLSDSRCVAPPKSGEDAHITHGRCELRGTTLNRPRFVFSYVLPILWDPGGVRSTPNVPKG